MDRGNNVILVIDGYNLIHRSRAGFKLGDHNVAFNFFRSLKALVDQFKPTRVYFTLEGAPKHRLELFPEYKANRKEREDSWNYKVFVEQKAEIIQLLKAHFPISVVWHPDVEGDDVIYNIIKRSSTVADWCVVSSDYDFMQLLDLFENVRVYDPIVKDFFTKAEFDYVAWKALRGDPSDNIPKAIPKCGNTTAQKLLSKPGLLEEAFEKNPGSKEAWERNLKLIRFVDADPELGGSSQPSRDWDAVKVTFDAWLFKSLTNDKAWPKYVESFDYLFGT